MLELVKLYDFVIGDEFMKKEVSNLSGGEKQWLSLLCSMFLHRHSDPL